MQVILLYIIQKNGFLKGVLILVGAGVPNSLYTVLGGLSGAFAYGLFHPIIQMINEIFKNLGLFEILKKDHNSADCPLPRRRYRIRGIPKRLPQSPVSCPSIATTKGSVSIIISRFWDSRPHPLIKSNHQFSPVGHLLLFLKKCKK